MKEQSEVHLPSPSFWPILLAAGFALIAIGVVSSIFVGFGGIVVVLVSIAGWALENRAEDKEHPHE